MKDTVNMAFSASPDNIIAMKNMYQEVKNLRDGSQAVKSSACTAVWAAVKQPTTCFTFSCRYY